MQEKWNQPHWLRFPKDMATRSPPPANLPEGPAHKLSNNAYFLRDTRRRPKPVVGSRCTAAAAHRAQTLISNTQYAKQIAAPGAAASTCDGTVTAAAADMCRPAVVLPVFAGQRYAWNLKELEF